MACDVVVREADAPVASGRLDTVWAGYFAEARHVDKQMRATPKVIFFDAVGTLIHLPRSVGEHYRDVASEFGLEPDAKALDRAFRQAWKSAPVHPTVQGPRADDDKGWWRSLVGEAMAAVLTGTELRRLDHEAYFERLYAHFAKPGVWEPYPEVSDVLSELKARGFRLGVISNFDRRLRAVFDGLGLTPLFEHLIISSEVGADKPAARIFTKALEAFGIESAQAVHVGDDHEKDGGAEALGLRFFHLERPHRTLRGLPAYLKRDDRA